MVKVRPDKNGLECLIVQTLLQQLPSAKGSLQTVIAVTMSVYTVVNFY